MSKRRPRAFPDRPFTVGELAELGMPSWHLRDPLLSSPTRGVRSSVPLEGVLERARAVQLVLPADAAFSHVTAAQLWGLPLPRCAEAQRTLDVLRPAAAAASPRRRGCHGHRGDRAVEELHGVRVVSLADTWCDLGAVTARGLGLEDLVVVGDHVVDRLDRGLGPADGEEPEWLRAVVRSAEEAETGARPRFGEPALRAALEARVRPRGKRVLVDALALVRSGARSPMETRARLVVTGAGLPEPELNAVVEARDGGFLLLGDLVWQRQRVVAEYQGEAAHAGIRHRSRDAARIRAAQAEGWSVEEIFAEDMFQRPRRVALLRRLAARLGVDPETLDIR
ncbi:MAG TPA: hypothetical protein VES95_07310 [Dermatophilaceae bacterium]|nr:hypothetical protein [Dermatophilaceae bacterium]